MEFKLELDKYSIEKVEANLKKALENGLRGAETGLKGVAEAIMVESRVECPVDTGTLVSTAWIGEPERDIGSVFIDMGYGGRNDKLNYRNRMMASQYMVIVHEDPITYHSKGKWKFLEDPVRRSVARMREELALNIRENMTIRAG